MSKIYSIGDEEELVADMPKIINERIKAELEEIKDKIQNMPNANPSYHYTVDVVDRYDVLEILDNHINQADCDNDCEHCEWTECPKE